MNGTKNQARVGTVRDAVELDVWIKSAQPMARVVYHHGFWAGHARESLIQSVQLAQERGLVFLVQDRRNLDVNGYDYVAIRSSRPVQADIKPVPHRPKSLAEQARAEGERSFRSSGR